VEYEIKDGIPLPKSRGRPIKYDINLDALKKGQMVEIPMSKTDVPMEILIIRNTVLRYQHRNAGKKFSVRKLDKGVGVWRVKWLSSYEAEQRIFTGVFSLGGYMSFELVVIFILVLIFTAMATGFAIWFNREGEDSE
jgi:hypothetical protein